MKTMSDLARDLDEYGADTTGMARRQARAEVAPDINRLNQGLAQIQSVIQKRQRAEMMALLDSAMSDWRAVNESPGFLSWLNGQNEITGQSRNSHLQDAWNSGDGQRVLRIFQEFKAAQQRQPVTPRGNDQQGWSNPSAGFSRDWPTTGQPLIRGFQIKAFYDDCASGKYSHRPEQKRALEETLQRSLSAGRVIE
jgi:hypothetical protein